jgi:circadian clock protein KaiC
MSNNPPVAISMLPTGIPGLDDVLGGGLPEFSFNIITGSPGAGKTTLAHQMMFELASNERPALYFTVLGEPPLKMLRYQQQMKFFDATKIGEIIHFVDLSDVVIEQSLSQVLATIVALVEERDPGIVIVDSFQTIVHAATKTDTNPMSLQRFVQALAVNLTSWQATTFLIGENFESDLRGNPAFTVADGIISLSQNIDRNSSVRKLQIVKSRGQAPMPGLHTFRITNSGIQIFPRISIMADEFARVDQRGRIATGAPGLDALLDGGIPAGDALLVSGPSGTGKSVLARQFIALGARNGEPGVIAVFEERPREYLRRANDLGLELEALERQGVVKIIYLRPLDLSPDEALDAIRQAVVELGAKRVVIDSLSGFELALAPTFRQDFRESLYRLVGALTGTGITVLLTMEIVQNSEDMRFSPYVISFLADNIILLRYVEIAGQLRKSLSVIKMRSSDHSKDFWLYEITDQGLIVRETLREYRGISIGAAELRDGTKTLTYPGLTEQETGVLRALIELGDAIPAAIARRTGVQGPSLTAALDRLIDLGYAIRHGSETDAVYLPVAQS